MSPVDVISGPFIVSVGECVERPQGPVRFTVLVSGTDGSRSVLRRYKEFVALDQELRRGARRLPPLPPRSLGRCCVPSGFLERRRRGLTTFLAAAVATDPHCDGPVLRDFLGLPSPPTLQLLFGDDCGSDGDTSCTEIPSCLSELKLEPIVETGLTCHESFATSPAPPEQQQEQ